MPSSLIVHYAYTRGRMRRRGVFAALLAKARESNKALQSDSIKVVCTLVGPDTEALAKHYRVAIMVMPVGEFLGDQT